MPDPEQEWSVWSKKRVHEEARERQRSLLQEFHDECGRLPRFNEEIPPSP